MDPKQEEQEIAKDGMIGSIPVNLKLSETIDMRSDAMDIAKLR